MQMQFGQLSLADDLITGARKIMFVITRYIQGAIGKRISFGR